LRFLKFKKKQSDNITEAFQHALSKISIIMSGFLILAPPVIWQITQTIWMNPLYMLAINMSSLVMDNPSPFLIKVLFPILFPKAFLLFPNIKKNLISISQLTKQLNCRVIFYSSSFDIQDQATRTVLGVGWCENGLYFLDQHHYALASIVSSNKPQFIYGMHN
jgi:hypothetical protein